jgi:hypothetical protein
MCDPPETGMIRHWPQEAESSNDQEGASTDGDGPAEPGAQQICLGHGKFFQPSAGRTNSGDRLFMHSLATSVNDARSKYDSILLSSHDHQLNDPSATTPHAATHASLMDGPVVGRMSICMAEQRGGGLCHPTSLLLDGGKGVAAVTMTGMWWS